MRRGRGGSRRGSFREHTVEKKISCILCRHYYRRAFTGSSVSDILEHQYSLLLLESLNAALLVHVRPS